MSDPEGGDDDRKWMCEEQCKDVCMYVAMYVCMYVCMVITYNRLTEY